MYVTRRATLVTVALILLASSFTFAHGHVAPSGGDQQTPPQPRNTTAMDQSSHTQNSNARLNVGGGDSGDADEMKTSVKPVNEEAQKGKPEAVLYYEITKRVKKCNLTLDDVQSVLSLKDDDEFMYMLADKLGYIVDGRYDDPHIPVIKSSKDDLIALLKTREALLRPQSQSPPGDSTPPVKPYGRVGFEVAKMIQSLGAEAVDELLHDFTVSGSLGYAVGVALGYTDGDVHMKYLETADEAEIRKALHQVLKSKMPKIAFEVTKKIQSLGADVIDELLTDFSLSGSLGYAVGMELEYSDEDEHMKYLENADEEKLRKQLLQIQKSKVSGEAIPTHAKDKALVVKSKGQIVFEVAKKIQSLGADAIDELLNDVTLSGVLGYAVGVVLGYPDGDEHLKYLETADETKLRKQLQQVLDSKMPSITIPTSERQGIEPRNKPTHVHNKGNAWPDKGKGTLREKSEAVLYFEIAVKRMNEYNLSLNDIRQVLSQADDDQFMYILADKLGYIVDGNYDDPHIPVIKSRKDDLAALLKERETLLSSPLQTSDQGSSVSSKGKAPVVRSNGQIGFEVAKKIQSLGADAIIKLLNDLTLSGSLGYVVGMMLGYSDRDAHMKYLENVDEDSVRKQLQQALKSKMPDRNELTSHVDVDDQEGEGASEIERQETDRPPSDESYNNVPSQDSILERKDKSDSRNDQVEENASDRGKTSQGKKEVNHSLQSDGHRSTGDESTNSEHRDAKQPPFNNPGTGDSKDETNELLYSAVDGDSVEPNNGKEPNNNVADQGNPAQSADLYQVEGEQASSNDDDDKHTSSSNLEPWHFVLIFLFLGAVVVIGALSVTCIRKRKYPHTLHFYKCGVSAGDFSRRQRRGEEYQPLI